MLLYVIRTALAYTYILVKPYFKEFTGSYCPGQVGADVHKLYKDDDISSKGILKFKQVFRVLPMCL